MEFAKNLKEALELGISKEEFMYVWEKEMDLQILNQNANNCGHGYDYSHSRHSANIEAVVIESKKLPEIFQFEIQTLKMAYQELKLQLLSLSNEIASQNQEFMTKLTLTVNEHQNVIMESVKSIKNESQTFKEHVDVRLDEISKNLGSLSAELKSEISEIKKKITASTFQNDGPVSEISSVSHSTHTVDSYSGEENVNIFLPSDIESSSSTTQTGNEFCTENNSKTTDKPKRSTKTKPFTKSYQNQTFFKYPKVIEKEHKVHNKEQYKNKSDPAKQNNTVKISQSTVSTVPEIANNDNNNTLTKTNPVKSSENVVSDTETKIPTEDTIQVIQATSTESDDSKCAKNNQTAQIFSPASTVNGANDISKWHNDTHTQPVGAHNETFEKKEPTNSFLSTCPKIVSGKLADYGVYFTIPESHSFYNCEEDFYTDYYKVKDIPCLVQMRLRLGKDGKLLVSALLSFLKPSKEIFPVGFEGSGYISARLSGGSGYTQIWDVLSKVYKMPTSDKDHCINAQVCLETNRNSYKNVTYSKLVDLGYDKNKQLQFYWEFIGYSIY